MHLYLSKLYSVRFIKLVLYPVILTLRVITIMHILDTDSGGFN